MITYGHRSLTTLHIKSGRILLDKMLNQGYTTASLISILNSHDYVASLFHQHLRHLEDLIQDYLT